jgi:Ca2+-binding RTX toxin-like protein
LVTDANPGATDTAFVSISGSGTLKDGAAYNNLTPDGTYGTTTFYTISGLSAAAATKELDALVFTPVAGQPNSQQTSLFYVGVQSSAGTSDTITSAVTTVTTLTPPVAPVISGTVPGQITGVAKPVTPFSQVVLTDPNSGTSDAAIIAVSGGGTLADGAGFSGLTFTGTPGLYTVTYTSAANLTKEVEALVYTPAASPTHSVETIGFNLVDVSTAGTSASNTATTLTVDPGPTTGKVSSTVPVGSAPVNLTSAILAAATPGIKGDTLTITADSTTGALGPVTLVNGQLTYSTATPALSHIPANGSQADSFAYTISDQYGDTATGTVSITVTNPADTINGPQYGHGTTQGTSGTDIINTFNYFNTIYSNGGNDVINAGQGNATVYTSTGDVIVNLNGYYNTVSGGDGNNNVSGSQGNTTLALGDGNDTVNTGGYNNNITLGNGNDTVNGGLGNDIITLGNGNDKVTVAGDPNNITVGSGNDTITGGSGDTTVVAGAGTDTITLSGYGNHVTLNGSAATVSGGQGTETIAVNGGKDNLSFSGYSDTATIAGTSTVSISDLANGLRLTIASSTQMDTITGFGTTDTSGVVDLKNNVGGYTSTAAIVNALQSDGHGGTMLSIGTGSIDFVNTAANQLHASNFKIG